MSPSRRILIVEDEPNVRLVFRTALEPAGYFVSEAGDGQSAIGQLRKTPVDVILLDLRMPVLDGIATLRRLRDAGDETAVVAITAHGSVSDAVAAMKMGVVVIPATVSTVTSSPWRRTGAPAASAAPIMSPTLRSRTRSASRGLSTVSQARARDWRAAHWATSISDQVCAV